MSNTLSSAYSTAVSHTMSYGNNRHFAAGSNTMAAPICDYCGYTICQCNYIYNNVTPERNYAGAYMAPTSPTFLSSQRLPPRQVEDRYAPAPPQSAGAFPYYSGQEQQQARHGHNDRVIDSDLINTFADGLYQYGQNNEHEARIAEMLAAFNASFIKENDKLATQHEAVFEPEEDFLRDGTIDPTKLSLPVEGKKVPCPKCGVLLKDEKSVSRHFSRKHNPNVEYYDCQEYGCEYSTQKKADLLRHARAKHNQDVDPKPFKCYLCGVGNSRRDNLKRHEATCTRKALDELSSL
ncbi:zinc finger protein [Venturia nashicola]|uniref:Zinc finger protein n=1 Tax=Venturia nashicola TaxID=86259 RepID=A0A4Z1P529_9PEZI|nr:zinc finger protein [Venturia nashicola]